MPRRGDEANRLGNDYEDLWFVDSLLDVLVDEDRSIVVAAYGDEGKGVDLIKRFPDGRVEFQSLKRQRTGETWSLRDLSQNGVLRALIDKVRGNERHRGTFVSGTTANELNELCEIAERCKTLAVFERHLKETRSLKFRVEEHLLPHCESDWRLTWEHLRRLRVDGMPTNALLRRIDQRVRGAIQRKDRNEVNTIQVRLLLASMILDWLGQEITKQAVVDILNHHGFIERMVLGDKKVEEQISRLTKNYVADVEGELIQNHRIVRAEAKKAFEELTGGAKEIVALVGAAGLGKSCVLAQTVSLLGQANVPHLVARLDLQTHARDSRQLGEDLGFPDSPCLILAGVARGAPCVLVLDQLDALSTQSGRNPQLWGVVDELRREMENHRNMRLLIACRGFDAEHDARIRKLLTDKNRSERIDLQLLSKEEVVDAVNRAGLRPELLGLQETEILRTPQNLNLYLQGNPGDHSAFQNVKELFDRYWDAKQMEIAKRMGRNPRFADVVTTLATWLSEHQSLAAPLEALDNFAEEANAMASAHVLVRSNRKWRFFHESFFDYAFARGFVSQGGKLTELLLSSKKEQHLFRRAQARQILTYQRDWDFEAYLADLKSLLKQPAVRFHIKRVALDWLRALDLPRAEEWRLLASFESDPDIATRVRMVPHNSVGWFDVLKREGAWSAWLTSTDADRVRHAVWLLILPNVNRARSEQIAELLIAHMDDSDSWRSHFLQIIRFGGPHHSRRMFDLFIAAFKSGWFDGDTIDWHFTIHIAEDQPNLGIEFLGHFLERWSTRVAKGGNAIAGPRDLAITDGFLEKLEERSSRNIAPAVLPRFVRAVQANACETEDGRVLDHIWAVRSLSVEHGFRESVLGALRRSMEQLAADGPDELNALTTAFEGLRHETLAYLLLSAWAKNGSSFGDRIARYLCADSNRLDIGYALWGGGGYGPGHVSREAVAASAAHCSAHSYLGIESAILKFEDFYEKTRPKRRGYKQLLLLAALPATRRTAIAQARFEQLRRKFPDEQFEAPEVSKVEFVGAPIDAEKREKMTDRQWIRAMEKYSEKGLDSFEDFRKGGAEGLASALRRDAAVNKTRFAQLAMKMPATLPATFFARLLDGLVSTDVGEDASKSPEATRLLSLDIIEPALKRLHALPGRPIGKELAWAIAKYASHPLSDDVLEIVAFYAVHDPDPCEELWKERPDGGTVYYGGDPEFAGLNCVRGAAAHTMAKLLFADKSRHLKLSEAVGKTCFDPSVAVRSMALECLTAWLNVDRDWAVEHYLDAVKDESELLGLTGSDGFLQYASLSHYAKLRPMLIGALKSPNEKARKVAARRITVSVLKTVAGEDDMEAVMRGDPACRAAAAHVFSDALAVDEVRAECRGYLKLLFCDPEKSVRAETDHCFRRLSDQQLSEEGDLIAAFIESEAFRDDPSQLCFALKESTAVLPDVTCAIAEKLLAVHREGHGDQRFDRFHGSGHCVSELVVRLYQQTKEAETKSRCLDIIDDMLMADIWSTDAALEKVER